MNHVDKLSALPHGTGVSRQIAYLRGICQHTQGYCGLYSDDRKEVIKYLVSHDHEAEDG